MSTDPLLHLLHGALEGDLSPEDQTRFQRALRDPRVRERYERLRRTQNLLRALPDQKPPPLAAGVTGDIRLSQALSAPAPHAPSLAATLAARVAREAEDAHPHVTAALRDLPRATPARSVAATVARRAHREAHHNPAPLVLVGGLVAAFAVLTASFAWPNLAAGGTVLRELLGGLPALVFWGFGLALAAAAAVTWRPNPDVQRAGSLAFLIAFAMIAPPLGSLFAGTGQQAIVRVGGDVMIEHHVRGNVVALGGNVILQPGARVDGEVVAFLGDVRQQSGATVQGGTSALLGEIQGTQGGLSTRPLPALGTASAFQPFLAWLGQAGAEVWLRLYLAALATLMLLLFVSGVEHQLAYRQRHDPVRTLALGLLVLGAAVPPLVLGAMSGFLVPAFVGGVVVLLALSVGLAVSLHDAGRVLVRALRLPRPDALGALLGLALFAAALSFPPLALLLWALGGCWGAGTLLLTRPTVRAAP